MKDGQIHEYFFPTHEGNEQYGLRKKEQYIYDNEAGYEIKRTHEYTVPHPQNSGYSFQYCMGGKGKYFIARKTIDNEEKKPVATETIKRTEENDKRTESLLEWKDSVESYLGNLVLQIEQGTKQSETEAYYEIVPQYNPKQVELEEGDVEGFVLHGVNSGQLCISMQRGGVTSEQLQRNKLFDGRLENGACTKFVGDEKAKIYIEKHLEGGLPTRSYYYSAQNPNNPNWGIGLGLSNVSMNPNTILGFALHDAQTHHAIKKLRAGMEMHHKVSDIVSHKAEATPHAELATLRYEYDISKIRERNRRGKNYS